MNRMLTYWFDRSRVQGRLELIDRDRLDLLQRMSTNDLAHLQQGDGCSTVLTTALARIIDRLIVYHRGETALAIANYPAKVQNWLQKNIFFQDKVKIRDVSATLGQLELHGPSASELVEALAPGASKSAMHHFVECAFSGETVLLGRTYPLIGDGFTLIAPNSVLDGLKAFLQGHGAVEADNAHYEALRIRAGLPGANHELTEAYIPLEANLWDSVSFTKGCYIGQEIVARMESRNRLARTLVSLTLDNAAPEGASLQTDQDERGQSGILTSVAILEGSDETASVFALSFIRPELAEVGTHFNVIVNDQRVASAEIVPLMLDTRREEQSS